MNASSDTSIRPFSLIIPLKMEEEAVKHDPEAVVEKLVPAFINPQLQDFQLTDLNDQVMEEIGKQLGVKYLHESEEMGGFPSHGIIYGPNHRPMLNFVCSNANRDDVRPVNVIFILNPASPDTYLSRKAMAALVPKDRHPPKSLKVRIHTRQPIHCCMSPDTSHFADANVLGADFLHLNGAMVHLDYVQRSCSLKKAMTVAEE